MDQVDDTIVVFASDNGATTTNPSADVALYPGRHDDMPRMEVNVKPRQAFDKLLFREGLGPKDAYLLLDGYGRGIHGHFDVNAIVRYTDRGRVFLVDNTFSRKAPDFHNSIMVIRDGRGGVKSIQEYNRSGDPVSASFINVNGETFGVPCSP